MQAEYSVCNNNDMSAFCIILISQTQNINNGGNNHNDSDSVNGYHDTNANDADEEVDEEEYESADELQPEQEAAV